MRPHHEEDQRDDQQPLPPPLMGGDGSHGPGVLVSTEQPRREENVDGETVTLQLKHPSNNDDNPILCSVVCNRRAIRASSTLINNLLDNMGRDDEVLPPFSTEHIPDELTLRRVVEFVTGVEPAIPEGHLTDEYFFDYQWTDNLMKRRAPAAADFCESNRQMFRRIVQKDGHRGGILKMLIAAHYLGCEKLMISTAAFLAMAVNAWCHSDENLNIFGDDPVLGTPEDPVARVPLHVLAEITNLFVNFPLNGHSVLKFSPTMFKSVSLVERVWGRDFSTHCTSLNFDDPFCVVALSFEHRLEHSPDKNLDLFDSRWSPTMNTYHKRWEKLIGNITTNCAKHLVGLPFVYPVYKSYACSADLSSPTSAAMMVVAKVAQMDPFFTAMLPRLPPGGVDAIADCWKEYYHFVTHKATAVSVELVKKEHMEQLSYLFAKNLNVHTVEIRTPVGERFGGEWEQLTNLLEATMIEHMIIRSELGVVLPEALPSGLKRLDLAFLGSSDAAKTVMRRLFEHSRQEGSCAFVLLDELVVRHCLGEAADTIISQLSELNVQDLYTTAKKTLRLFLERLPPRRVLPALGTYELVAGFRPEIEFMFRDHHSDCWRRVPACKDEGDLDTISSWEEVMPTFMRSL